MDKHVILRNGLIAASEMIPLLTASCYVIGDSFYKENKSTIDSSVQITGVVQDPVLIDYNQVSLDNSITPEQLRESLKPDTKITLQAGDYHFTTETTPFYIPDNCHVKGEGEVNFYLSLGTLYEFFAGYETDRWSLENVNFILEGSTQFRVMLIWGCQNFIIKDCDFQGFSNFARIRKSNNGRKNKSFVLQNLTGSALSPLFFNSCEHVLIEDCDMTVDSPLKDHVLYINYGNRDWVVRNNIFRGSDHPGYIVSIQGKDMDPETGRNKDLFFENNQFLNCQYGIVVNRNAENITFKNQTIQMSENGDIGVSVRGDVGRDVRGFLMDGFTQTGPGSFYVEIPPTGNDDVKDVTFRNGTLLEGTGYKFLHRYSKTLTIDNVQSFDGLFMTSESVTGGKVEVKNSNIDINGGNGRQKGLRIKPQVATELIVKGNTLLSSKPMTKKYISSMGLTPAQIISNNYQGELFEGQAVVSDNHEL